LAKRIQSVPSRLLNRVTINPPSDGWLVESALVGDEAGFTVDELGAEAEGEDGGKGTAFLGDAAVGVVDVLGGNGTGGMETATLWTVLQIL
jgi:hypothetical protein